MEWLLLWEVTTLMRCTSALRRRLSALQQYVLNRFSTGKASFGDAKLDYIQDYCCYNVLYAILCMRY